MSNYASTIEELLRGSHLNTLFQDPNLMSSVNGTGAGGAAANKKSFNDVHKWQFWPRYVAMGNLIGNVFNQMMAFECENGLDVSKLDNQLDGPKLGKSFIAFDFRRQMLVIKAQVRQPREVLPPALRPLDAELSFEDIASQGITIDSHLSPPAESDKGRKFFDVVVTISTRRPPKFYSDFEGSEQLASERRNKMPVRRRATAMDFAVAGTTERDAGPIKAVPEGPCGYPTFWNTYRWILRLEETNAHKLLKCADTLRLLAQDDPELDIMSTNLKTRKKWNVVKLDQRTYGQLYGEVNMDKVEFAPRCLIEGLIAHGILRPGDTLALVEALKYQARDVEMKCRILESLYNEERIRDVKKVVMAKARFLRRHPPPTLHYLVLIRTVQVTPTRVLVSPPQQEPSNSVTRRYADRLDGIIRVQFTDEEDRLFVQDYTKQADSLRPEVGVMARIRRALQHGIEIGGQRFFPVASSSSQQKDHSIWFINHKLIDGMELRNWMGNVAETVVAKHSARMGLPFSTSRVVNLNIELGENVPDIEYKDHCFTDGCALAGEEVLREAARSLNARGINTRPSAIQFRLGGAKGVLSYWPGLVKPHEVKLRPSLIKFESNLKDLNVVRLTKYQTAFLNRQFILIMCANGIPEELIIGIFEKAIGEIKGLKERVVSQRMTKNDASLLNICSDFPLTALIRAGYHANPMVRDFCDLIECRMLQDIRWRARVRLEEGVFLIGIADESGTLEEGEIFCQYQENEDTAPVIVQSQVLVCRAPALHPGDIRRAWAVDRPALRHLKNVVVFSTKGERGMPNMLGGGDLDGDDYTIIWDQRFVNTLVEYQPMDYTAPPPVRVKKVTQAHLNENFVQYILNDVLGQVDNLHLALSDKLTPFHQDCLYLSEIHSLAVDFAKTGRAATVPIEIRRKLREWPDFMDQNDVKLTYPSQKILGRLFRLVSPDPRFKPSDIAELGYPTDSRLDRYPIYDSLIELLKPIKKKYEHDLSWDMRRYRVQEPEIPSGIAIRNRHRKRARDQNLNEPLRDAYEIHVQDVREASIKAVEKLKFTTSLPSLCLIARHAYALTYDRKHVEEWEQEKRAEKRSMPPAHLPPVEDEEHEEDMRELRRKPMTTFAWCFWEELVQVVQQGL